MILNSPEVFKGNDDLFIHSTRRKDPNKDPAISKVANIRHLHADAKACKHRVNRAAARTSVAYQALHISAQGWGSGKVDSPSYRFDGTDLRQALAH